MLEGFEKINSSIILKCEQVSHNKIRINNKKFKGYPIKGIPIFVFNQADYKCAIFLLPVHKLSLGNIKLHHSQRLSYLN